MFHANELVTRAEEWCVEAETWKRPANCQRLARGTGATSVPVSHLEVERDEKAAIRRPHLLAG